MPYIKRFYDHFQMIGYEIPTGTASKPGQEYNLSGYGDPGPNYLPVPQSLLDDARIRLKRLAGVIDLARPYVDRRQNVLKIFMAPEFYLRPKEGEVGRSYSSSDMIEIQKALREMFVHESFIDWLFLPGTIVWSLNPRGTGFSYEPVVWNTAVTIKGGQRDAPFAMVNKRHYSPVDSIEDELRPEKNERFKDLIDSWEARKVSLQRIDNIRIGIEICRDHSLLIHQLKSTFQMLEHKMFPDDVPLPDLHLLTANSVDIVPTSVIARKGGYILREDGTGAPLKKPYSQIGAVEKQVSDDILHVDKFRELGSPSKIIPEVMIETGEKTEVLLTNPFISEPIWTRDLSGALKVKVPEQTNQNHPQRVVIFSPQRLPVWT